MKKAILLSLLFLVSMVATAQDKDEHREKIKALKTAHLTEGLDLTAKEAQKFWPIYNAYEQQRRELYREEHQDVGNLECLTETEANKKLEHYVELEKQDFLLKQQYYEDLRDIFSARRIMLLKQLEDEFNRKLMREYRARREKNRK